VTVQGVAHAAPILLRRAPILISVQTTPMNNRFDLTPEEQRILAEATPEQWAEVAQTLGRDPEFWVELGQAIVQGFFQGLSRGLDDR
jgi:hypothetical protein